MTAIHAATDRSSVTNPSKITRVDHVAPNAAGPHDDRPLAPAVPAFSLFLTPRSCSVSPEAASASTWFLVVGQAPAARSGDGHLEDRTAARPSALRWPARRHPFPRGSPTLRRLRRQLTRTPQSRGPRPAQRSAR